MLDYTTPAPKFVNGSYNRNRIKLAVEDVHDPFFKAIITNNLSLAMSMIEEDPVLVNKTHHYGWTPVMIAIQAGHLEMTRLLIERGGKPFKRVEQEKEIIIRAMQTSNFLLIKYVVEDLQVRVNYTKKFMLFNYLVKKMKKQNINGTQILQLLIENGMDIHARFRRQYIELNMLDLSFLEVEHTNFIRTLIKAGLNLSGKF